MKCDHDASFVKRRARARALEKRRSNYSRAELIGARLAKFAPPWHPRRHRRRTDEGLDCSRAFCKPVTRPSCPRSHGRSRTQARPETSIERPKGEIITNWNTSQTYRAYREFANSRLSPDSRNARRFYPASAPGFARKRWPDARARAGIHTAAADTCNQLEPRKFLPKIYPVLVHREASLRAYVPSFFLATSLVPPRF